MPFVSRCEAVRAFERAVYTVDHQTGSHVILRQMTEPHRRLSIPNHPELGKGLLRSLVREAGLTMDSADFCSALVMP
mgnify:CR=1 FL=1